MIPHVRPLSHRHHTRFIFLTSSSLVSWIAALQALQSSPLITLRASGWRYLFPATQRHIGKVRITAQAGRFGGKIVFCVVCITHKRFPHERLEISTRQSPISRCIIWSTTTWVHEPSLIWCFLQISPPITFHVMELVLFVFFDVNSPGFALQGGDKSPSFGVDLSLFALHSLWHHTECMSLMSFYRLLLTSPYGRATYGYTIRQSLMGFSDALANLQHTCDIDIDIELYITVH